MHVYMYPLDKIRRLQPQASLTTIIIILNVSWWLFVKGISITYLVLPRSYMCIHVKCMYMYVAKHWWASLSIVRPAQCRTCTCTYACEVLGIVLHNYCDCYMYNYMYVYLIPRYSVASLYYMYMYMYSSLSCFALSTSLFHCLLAATITQMFVY